MKRHRLNFFYFTIFFACILLTALYSISEAPYFFICQAILQCIIEVGSLFMIGILANRWLHRYWFDVFIGISFALLLAHFINFTIIRLVGTSISYVFRYFFGANGSHIIAAFQALNFSNATIIIYILLLLGIPLAGIFLYRIIHLLTKKIPWNVSMRYLGLALLGSVGLSFTLDLCCNTTRSEFRQFQKSLPFGTTFLPPTPIKMTLPKSFAEPRKEEKIAYLLAEKKFSTEKKPNIYLFIIEALRKDFITANIAPHLSSFAEQNFSFKESYSNANSTHLSWFSIFHANYPYHWTRARNTLKNGSVPLQILKQLGYQIRVYSSPDLRFFHMDEIIFGENKELGDHIEQYSSDYTLSPCERDQLGLKSFAKDLEKNRSGNVFIFFFDGTHSEYSVPKDFPLKFEPVIDKIDYLSLSKKNLEPLKNRYRNSIHYTDSLLGEFLNLLKEKELYNDSIIAITGDHGEEFFEEGALFHGTRLNHYQISVPLFYKFQENSLEPCTTCSTHLDIFPSIIHYLTKKGDLKDLFDGESIFSSNRWPYHISVSHNGAIIAQECLIETKEKALRFRFLNPENIYEDTNVELIECTSSHAHDMLSPLLLVE